MHLLIYEYIYIYPVALRAISATVPTAFLRQCIQWLAPSSSSRPLPWQGIWGKAARGRGLGPSFSFAPNVALVLYVPVALSLGLCFFRVKVLQKPNLQNHKNCKKKHRKLYKNHKKSTPLGSFWGDFGVIWVPLGVLWRPGAPQGTPKGTIWGRSWVLGRTCLQL